jgi:hypothetical protein
MEGQSIGIAGYNPGGIQAGSQRAHPAPPTVKPVNPSCFGNVEDVCRQSEAVASRVEKLISRLCGFPPPSPDAGNAIQGEPNGMLEAADRQARDIRANLQRILDATDRLEKQLP